MEKDDRMKSLVSIIIPVYNGEKYVMRCLNSIAAQTYDNLEIILLNDGSTDNTKNILEEYERMNKKITCYSHANMGVGKTRNRGIDMARGVYIVFVDADDTIKPEYIEMLVKAIEDKDIVISGYQRIRDEKEVSFEMIPKESVWSEFKYTATSGKMYRLSYINNKKIRYQEFPIGEDICFSMQTFSQTKKIKILSYAGYQAHYNEHSVTKTMNASTKRNKIVPLLTYVEKNLNFDKYDRKMVLYFYTKTVVHHLINQHAILPFEIFKMEFNETVDWLHRTYKKYNKKLFFHYERADSLSVNIGVILFVFFEKLNKGLVLFNILKKLKYVRNT